MTPSTIAPAQSRSRALHRLTARQVETAQPGAHPDGGGLYLRVAKTGTRKWELRYSCPKTGVRQTMGLGGASKGQVSLANARQLAAQARDQLALGIDPLSERRQAAISAAQVQAPPKTFGKLAEEWMDQNEHSLSNMKHRAQWRSTLRTHAAPFWDKVPAEVTTDDVLAVLRPIWLKTPETAKRTQGRIERILNAARAAGLRTGENPAQWKGHLDMLLPKRPRAKHHPALPYASAPAFMAELRARSGIAARGLEFLILTGARSNEVRGMTWDELDLGRRTWTIPADRMKARRIHRVPLSDRACAILAEMDALRADPDVRDALVFPGTKERSMSDMTLSAVLKRMRSGDDRLRDLLRDAAGDDVVVHGFRSTFRDWAEDVARIPARVVEAALAHTIKDKAEAAYRRGDAFDARVELMATWDRYLA